jgi:hypothetical protein
VSVSSRATAQDAPSTLNAARPRLRRDERSYSNLMELQVIGVRLAIDDFGTGYSSLSYLRELPIDLLKVDQSFVDGIATSEQRLALVQGIVQIASMLQMEVVAEGIESEAQRDLLISMGCPVRAGLPAGHAARAHPDGGAYADRAQPGFPPAGQESFPRFPPITRDNVPYLFIERVGLGQSASRGDAPWSSLQPVVA